MKIEDNLLDQHIFDQLQTLIIGEMGIAWFYVPVIEIGDYEKNQFIHWFYNDGASCSPHLDYLTSVFEIITPATLYRIRANLMTHTPTIVKNIFHTDIIECANVPEKLKQWTTSIFYVNSNNGYTEFEDGTKVESVANRLVTFPANLKHRGTSCTDENIRVVINFDYFK